MSEWTMTTVGDVAEIFDGPHATPKKTESGPWFLSISSLKKGKLDLNESAHLSEADFQKWTRRVTPREGDVLFSYETRLGEASLMPVGVQGCLGRRMGLLRPKASKADSRFLLYAYLGPEFQQVIRERSIHGATVDRIPLVDLSGWPIRLPSFAQQKAIADLLGALDDKIAVNDRIVSTYEDLLRAEFEDLAIDVDPDGSTEITASILVEFNPKLSVPKDGTVVYLDMAAVPTGRATVQEWARREPKSGTRFANGDTVMARITPCLENGKTAFIDFMQDGEVGIGSTEFIVMRARPGIPVQLPYFLARSPRFRNHAIQNMVGSSGRQRVGVEQIVSFPLMRPDEGELARFGEIASSAFSHLRSVTDESRELTELRDYLLPRLMSGEIRVRDAEKAVEDVT